MQDAASRLLRKLLLRTRVNKGHDQKIAQYLLSPVNCACYYAPPCAPCGHVAHTLAFFEASESAAHYGGVVDEDILTTLVGGDEAVALLLAEPLYRSLGHAAYLLLWGSLLCTFVFTASQARCCREVGQDGLWPARRRTDRRFAPTWPSRSCPEAPIPPTLVGFGVDRRAPPRWLPPWRRSNWRRA